jgi:lipopolysaccharide export system protein LptC
MDHNENPDKIDRSSLQFLRPRETKRMLKARAARPLWGLFRLGLPVVSFVVLIALILWPMINPNKVATAIMNKLPDIVVQNPRYSGVDSKNQPYTLSAIMARRPGGIHNIYDLDKPQGELTLQSGNWLYGKADYGRYDQDTRKLWLGGNVQLFHDKGYQFTSDETQVDIEGNFAWGEKPVLIQGSFGEIRGQGFRLLDDGTTLIVKGPASAILSLHSSAASDKPAVTKP